MTFSKRNSTFEIERIMNRKLLACCLAFLIGAAGVVHAADDTVTLAVTVDKVVYQPGGKGEATVHVESTPADSSTWVVRSRLEYGLDDQLALPDVLIDPSTTNAIVIPFTAPTGTGGCAIRTALMEEDRLLAEAQDVFVVGKNPFRLGQQASTGGDLAANKLPLYAPVDGVWPTRWREMKGTYLEINCLGPGEFCGLKTDWDQWVSMQGKFKRNKEVIRAFTREANRLGLKVMMYNNATPSGSIGTEWVRKHPEWISYNYQGSMQAMMNAQDIEKTKSWHQTMQPGQIGGFHPLLLMLNDRALIEFGCDQMLAAADDMGLGGVRFDGHWIIGPSWTGLGFDMHGRRPTRGESLDAVNARNTRYMEKYLRERKPDFYFGYNYGLSYEQSGGRSPEAYRAACEGGGMVLWEGATFGDESYTDWRNGALGLRDNALRVHQHGGIHYGSVRFLGSGDRYSRGDLSHRYVFITNFAATSHIVGAVYPGHPGENWLQGLYFRFALRYQQILYNQDIRPILKPEDHLAVTVNGETSDDLWWKLYTYKRPLKDGFQLITHLVNMPAPGVTKQTSTPDKEPAPLKDVRIAFADKPSRIFLLDPEATPWMQQVEAAMSITIPELKAWKILVQEFPGTGDHIPIEVIPEKSFAGRDLLPEPENGKIVFPILSYVRGEFGTSLVADKDALLGHAFLCTPASVENVKVMDGPRKDTPTMMPGRLRMTLRFKVADNSSPKKVCKLTGRFGDQIFTCDQFEKPGVYQSFSYEYDLEDGKSDSIALFYYGETDLYMDSVVVEQLTLAQDRDLFSKRKLDVDSRPARKGYSKKAHLARGLWHDYFGFDEALERAGIESTEAWETIFNDFSVIAPGLPATLSDLMNNDLVALLNIAGDSLGPVHRKNLREYVHRGGTLFVGGGARAYGHGSYMNTFLEEILPVEVTKFDLRKAEGRAQVLRAADGQEATQGIEFSEAPRNLFFHEVKVKPGAVVLLRAGDEPILTTWRVGKGAVYAMTGTPLGESEEGMPWWRWEGWQTLLDRILEEASPGSEVTFTEPEQEPLPVLGQLTEIAEGFFLFDDGPIRSSGSITFSITPDWNTDNASLEPLVPISLFSAQSPDGVRHYRITIEGVGVRNHRTYALTCAIATESPGEDRVEHLVQYPIRFTPQGDLRFEKSSQWSKGEERNIAVKWTPSQILIKENGETMAARGFLKEVDVSNFNEPLYVGADENGRLARVAMKDIVIRGE